MATLEELAKAARAWAKQEAHDIKTGAKIVPGRSTTPEIEKLQKTKLAANFDEKGLPELRDRTTTGAIKSDITRRPEKDAGRVKAQRVREATMADSFHAKAIKRLQSEASALARTKASADVHPSKTAVDITPYQIGPNADAKSNRALAKIIQNGAANDLRRSNAEVGIMKPSAPHVDTQRAEVPKMRERWVEMQKSRAEQRSTVKPMSIQAKKASRETKQQMAERVYKSQTQTMQSSMAESDLAMVGQTKAPIGEGQRDLGRSVAKTIQRGQEGDTELLKIAKGRAKAGVSVAGPDTPASKAAMGVKPKALSFKQKWKLSQAAGKMGGKLGAYGMVKGIVEGADTLRKLKSGAYDLTPEGTAKPRKGVVES